MATKTVRNTKPPTTPPEIAPTFVPWVLGDVIDGDDDVNTEDAEDAEVVDPEEMLPKSVVDGIYAFEALTAM